MWEAFQELRCGFYVVIPEGIADFVMFTGGKGRRFVGLVYERSVFKLLG